MNEGEQGALDEEWSTGLLLHQLRVAVGLVITKRYQPLPRSGSVPETGSEVGLSAGGDG